MADDVRRDFGEYYPDGGKQTAAPAQAAEDSVARSRLDALAATVAALGTLGDAESLGDVKDRVNEVVEKVAEV